MSDRTMELLDYINESDMQRFESASAKRKAQLILKNFQNYKNAQSKFARAKTDEEKDAFSVHTERFWLLANKQVRSLSDEEMTVYLSAIQTRLAKVIAEQNDDKVLDNKLFYGTVIRQLPENMSDTNNGARAELNEMLQSLDYSFEK